MPTTETTLAVIASEIQNMSGEVVAITEREKQERDSLIARGTTVTAVATFEDQTQALARRNDLKDWLKRLEDAKTAAKRPIDQLGKKILRVVEEAALPAEKERDRLNGLVNHFQAEQDRIRREKEAEIERERQRIANEAAAAQRAAEEAERARLRAEALAADAEHAKGKKAEVMKAEAERQRLAAEAATEAALEAQLAAETTPEPVIVEPEGKVAKKQMDFRLLGATEASKEWNLRQFVRVYPQFCKIEIKRRDLLEAINSGGLSAAPGIEIYERIQNLR